MQKPATESDLLTFLKNHDIVGNMHRHPPVHTVEDAKLMRGKIQGGHCKCLFVRDKKKRYALIVMDENKTADLKALATILGMGRLSFASADRLEDMLGVKPGSVTPFALINAIPEPGSNATIDVALDTDMLKSPLLNYHPLHNSATLTITNMDLLVFIKACGHVPREITI